jgi:hypothetical protein
MKNISKMYAVFCILIALSITGFAQHDEKDGEKTASFNVQKGGRLEVKVDFGEITIIPWDKQEVSIRATGLDEDEIQYLKMKGDKNKVTVKLHGAYEESSHDAEFEIRMPAEFDAELSTGGGDIKIEGDLKGSVEGSTGGGSITLKNVLNGKLSLSTGGGDVRGGTIGGDVDLSTGGGSVTLDDVQGNVRTSSGGGDIRIGKASGTASVSTGGGTISVNGATGEVKLSTGGGDVDVRDASGRVKVSTGGGNVDLKNITGSIVSSTGGGDVTAELNPSGKGDSKISTGGGDIKLYIVGNAKATIEATINIDRKWSKNVKKYKIYSDFKADSYEENEDDEEIRAVYNINGGGDRIILSTSQSNIRIMKK